MSTDTDVVDEVDDTIGAEDSVEFEPTVDDGTANDDTLDETPEQPVADDSDSDTVYTLKVDGEEVEVSLDELLNGYSRQADYTQKTQALAAEKQNLQTLLAFSEALTRDPQAAIKALADVHGIQFAQPTEDLSELDPLERELRELRTELSQIKGQTQTQAEQARVAQVRSEAAKAVTTAKLDVAPEDLIQFAFENQIGNLDIAAQHMALVGRANARKAEVVKVRQGKRAAQVVSGGGNRNAKTTAPPVESIEDAFRQAFAEHTSGR